MSFAKTNLDYLQKWMLSSAYKNCMKTHTNRIIVTEPFSSQCGRLEKRQSLATVRNRTASLSCSLST